MLQLLLAVTFIGVATSMTLDGSAIIDDNRFEPQVAFNCGYPSAYLTRSGWLFDRAQGCMNTADDILAYCSLKYPRLEITNVIPMASEAVIANWSTFQNDNSNVTLTVRPYRCIVGEFSSDALVVPEDCLYQVHSSKVRTIQRICSSYFDWNSTVHSRCADSNQMLYSFSVLEPCGVGMFSDAEYVCCPTEQPSSPAPQKPIAQTTAGNTAKPGVPVSFLLEQGTEDENDYAYSEDEYNYEDDEYYGEEAEAEAEAEFDDTDPDASDELFVDDYDDYYDDEMPDDYADEEYEYEYEDEDESALPDDRDYDPTKNYYKIYMETPTLLGATETEAYAKACRFVKYYYDSQKHRLMQQLVEVELSAGEREATNATVAQQFIKDGIDTVRRLYNTTNRTYQNVKQSMYLAHEERVLQGLEQTRQFKSVIWNTLIEQARKNHSIVQYGVLFKFLKDYMVSEQNERIHMINQYEHLLDTNSDAAQIVRQKVISKVREVQERLREVGELLHASPYMEALSAGFDELTESYADVDQEVRLLFPDLPEFEEPQPQLPENHRDGPVIEYPMDMELTTVSSDLSKEPFIADNMWTLIIVVGVCSMVLVIVVTSVIISCCLRRPPKLSPHKRQQMVRIPQEHPIVCGGSLLSPPVSVYKATTISGAQIRVHENPMQMGYAVQIENDDKAQLVENDELNC